ncbi:MAG TPA: hypothetical protein VJT31_08670 [Rugosimonospora sp.]|nr:hypothetical protein [Rugosimonospora sp.]
MPTSEPAVESALVQLDDLPIEELVGIATVLAHQVDRFAKGDPADAVAEFTNVI